METITDNFTKIDAYNSKIYINVGSLSKEFCDDVITKFDESPNKYNGVVHAGYKPKIKDTKDMIIYRTNKDWREIYDTLYRELKYNISKYVEKINNVEDYKSVYNNTDIDDYKLLINQELHIDFFMTQRYTQNTGRYIYHNDFYVDYVLKKYRVLTFLWYLNDVDIGGETTFEGLYKIKPQTGKLIIFPSCWTYPHCGKMPISSDKYIITGWIYAER